MTAKTPRMVLSFKNAAEDMPTFIGAYGKTRDGECAMVLRPREDRFLLVHHDKKGSAFYWNESVSSAPERPAKPIGVKESIQLAKDYQKGLPKAGPITLRGNWKGYLYCEEDAPKVVLERKLASYGTLLIESVPGKGWKYRIARTEKWFSKQGEQEGMAKSLASAIEKGLAAAMGLLGEACSLRDSHRRAAFDTGFAETHPIKPAREGKDPIERYEPKDPKPAKEAKPAKEPKQTRGSARSTQTAATSTAGTPSESKRGTSRKSASRAEGASPIVPIADAGGEIDPEKDKLLLDAFSKAVAAALGGGT